MPSTPPITFEVSARDGEARAGVLTTRRGLIETPVFMPVGTAGTVKGMRFEALEDDLDARIILATPLGQTPACSGRLEIPLVK